MKMLFESKQTSNLRNAKRPGGDINAGNANRFVASSEERNLANYYMAGCQLISR